MSRVLRSVRKRKKGHTLGAVDVIDREEYAELEVDAKVALIRSLVPLGLLHIEELLDEEVTALAGERYARKAPSVGGRRPGSNPGTVAATPGRSGWPASACRVDLRALPGEHPQAHAAGRQVLHGVDQVGEGAAEAVEFPDDEHVARPERAYAGAVVADAGRDVVVDVAGVDARGLQRVALQVQRLRAVRL